MKPPRPEKYKNFKENINKDVRNLFRLTKLEKETNDPTVKDIRNIFRLKKQNKAIKEIIIRDISNLFEPEEEDYYKPVTVSYFSFENYQ